MTVHYHRHKQKTIPNYLCQREGIEHRKPICQSTNGEVVDKAVGKLVNGGMHLTPVHATSGVLGLVHAHA